METEVMGTTVTVEQLATRVTRLEQTVERLCNELPEPRILPESTGQAPSSDLVADKQMWRQAFDQLFADFGIQAKPIGAEKLQEMMAEANLEPNEISRGLIAMRDE
jgi:hypothetical protein